MTFTNARDYLKCACLYITRLILCHKYRRANQSNIQQTTRTFLQVLIFWQWFVYAFWSRDVRPVYDFCIALIIVCCFLLRQCERPTWNCECGAQFFPYYKYLFCKQLCMLEPDFMLVCVLQSGNKLLFLVSCSGKSCSGDIFVIINRINVS